MLQLAHCITRCISIVSLTSIALEHADGLGDLDLVLQLHVMEKPKGRRKMVRVTGDLRIDGTSVCGVRQGEPK